MGSWFQIDVDDLKMFAGREWHDLGDECAHSCEHRSIAVIGWGPNMQTYELEECTDCGCRAWRDGRWTKARQRHQDSGFWWGRMVWRSPRLSPGSPEGEATKVGAAASSASPNGESEMVQQFPSRTSMASPSSTIDDTGHQ